MPSLVLFGKRTALAGDDLRIASVCAILLRVIQFCFLVALLVFMLEIGHDGGVEAATICDYNKKLLLAEYGEELLITYWCLAMTLVLVSIPLEVWICKTSSRGSPTQVEERKLLGPLCVFKIIPLSVLRGGALALVLLVATTITDYCRCTITAAHRPMIDFNQCGPHYHEMYHVLSALSIIHFMEVGVAAFLYMYFIFKVLDPHKCVSALLGPGPPSRRGTGWQLTCQMCCTCTSLLTCCLFGGLEATFADFVDVATALEDFFDGGESQLDVTVTDILAAMLLLGREQHLAREACREELSLRVAEQQRRCSTQEDGRGLVILTPLYSGSARLIIKRQPPSCSSSSIALSSSDQEGPLLQQQESLKYFDAFEEYPVQESSMLVSDNDDKGAWTRGKNIQSTTAGSSARLMVMRRGDSNNGSSLHDSSRKQRSDSTSHHSFHSTLYSDRLIQYCATSGSNEEEDDDEQQVEEGFEIGDKQQQQQQQEARNSYLPRKQKTTYFETADRPILQPLNHPEDRLAITEGAHFMRLALAAYGVKILRYHCASSSPSLRSSQLSLFPGHLFYLVNHTPTGCCTLGYRYMTCPLVRQKKRRKLTVSEDDDGEGHSVPENRFKMFSNCCCALGGGGDTFGCQRVAFLQETGYSPDTLLYANFISGLSKRPYCIVLDEPAKAVVLVIRGTLSLEDVVADLSVKPQPLDEAGEEFGFDGRGAHCHAGFYRSARWILRDLKRHEILESVLGQRGVTSDAAKRERAAQQNNPAAAASTLPPLECLVGSNPGEYRLYVVGHSLGAGVAAVLSLLLRAQYPTLKGLCFAPPGCVFSRNLIPQTEPFMTSYVVGFDIIPRLSIHSLENLRNDVLEMVARIKVPKHEVLGLNPFASTPKEESERKPKTRRGGKRKQEQQQSSSSDDDDDDEEDDGEEEEEPPSYFHHRRTSIPNSPFVQQLAEFSNHARFIKTERSRDLDWDDFEGDGPQPTEMLSPSSVDLYPPGRIVHCVKTVDAVNQTTSSPSWFTGAAWTATFSSHPTGATTDEDPKTSAATTASTVPPNDYTPIWGQPEDFHEIALAKSFATDHDPSNYDRVLQGLAETLTLQDLELEQVQQASAATGYTASTKKHSKR